MRKNLCYITLLTAILLSCSLSVRIRNNNKWDVWNSDSPSNGCGYGHWCLGKEENSYNYILTLNGTKNGHSMEGTSTKLDGSTFGPWFLIQTSNKHVVGVVRSSDGNTQFNLIALPVNH